MSDFKWFEDSVETTKLPIGDGAWIEVKNFLTIEDHLAIQSSAFGALRKQRDTGDSNDMDITLNAERQKFVRILRWAVNWNATRKGKNGQREPVALNERALRSMSKAAFEALDKALDAHVEAQEAEGKQNASTDGEASTTSADTSASATPTTSEHPQN